MKTHEFCLVFLVVLQASLGAGSTITTTTKNLTTTTTIPNASEATTTATTSSTSKLTAIFSTSEGNNGSSTITSPDTPETTISPTQTISEANIVTNTSPISPKTTTTTTALEPTATTASGAPENTTNTTITPIPELSTTVTPVIPVTVVEPTATASESTSNVEAISSATAPTQDPDTYSRTETITVPAAEATPSSIAVELASTITPEAVTSVSQEQEENATTFSNHRDNDEQRRKQTLVISAAAGGGGAAVLLLIVLVVVLCRRRRSNKKKTKYPGDDDEGNEMHRTEIELQEMEPEQDSSLVANGSATQVTENKTDEKNSNTDNSCLAAAGATTSAALKSSSEKPGMFSRESILSSAQTPMRASQRSVVSAEEFMLALAASRAASEEKRSNMPSERTWPELARKRASSGQVRSEERMYHWNMLREEPDGGEADTSVKPSSSGSGDPHTAANKSSFAVNKVAVRKSTEGKGVFENPTYASSLSDLANPKQIPAHDFETSSQDEAGRARVRSGSDMDTVFASVHEQFGSDFGKNKFRVDAAEAFHGRKKPSKSGRIKQKDPPLSPRSGSFVADLSEFAGTKSAAAVAGSEVVEPRNVSRGSKVKFAENVQGDVGKGPSHPGYSFGKVADSGEFFHKYGPSAEVPRSDLAAETSVDYPGTPMAKPAFDWVERDSVDIVTGEFQASPLEWTEGFEKEHMQQLERIFAYEENWQEL